jgi:farnesyl diphosphate synthase
MSFSASELLREDPNKLLELLGPNLAVAGGVFVAFIVVARMFDLNLGMACFLPLAIGSGVQLYLNGTFDACTAAFAAYEQKELVMWTVCIASTCYVLSSLFNGCCASSSSSCCSGGSSKDDCTVIAHSVATQETSKATLATPRYPTISSNASTKDVFMQTYEMLSQEMVDLLPEDLPEETKEWVRSMMEYTVKGGKMNRGLAAVQARITMARELEHRSLTSEEMFQACALGWCVEWLQAFFLVADDIMDQSETRRDQPCWYKLRHIQMVAINDSFILEAQVYKILKKHFANSPVYFDLVDLFLETTFHTEIGQLMDLTTSPPPSYLYFEDEDEEENKIDFTRFTVQRYKLIVKYKTAFYSFYLPIAMGIVLSGIKDKEVFDTARDICLEMGEYFQVQDDVLDCFGDPEVIGKVGTDIQDAKCSWLMVHAMQMADEGVRQQILDNYGIDDEERIQTVKDIFRDLQLQEKFEQYEEESYERIIGKINQVADRIPREVFEFLLNKIYKRQK